VYRSGETKKPYSLKGGLIGILIWIPAVIILSIGCPVPNFWGNWVMIIYYISMFAGLLILIYQVKHPEIKETKHSAGSSVFTFILIAALQFGANFYWPIIWTARGL
jgi:uncharacterized membrane protein YjfL (UPF0719 family)